MNGEGKGEGLSYKDYLRARLFVADADKKILRLGDVMEMDIRRTLGNEHFMIDHCLDIFCAQISVGTRFGYEARIERIYGYEE